MIDGKNNVVGGIAFLIFILVLAIGGFFLTKSLTSKDNDSNNTKVQKDVLTNEHKIDKEKDFIYYSNEKFISIEPDITYKDVTINLDTAETINKELKTELDSIRNTVKYIKDNELDPNREIMYEDEIYSASERNYETYEYKEYISLLVKDYEFNCYDGSLLKRLKSYVFNVTTGKLLLDNDLLDMYNTNMDIIKAMARDQLLKDQVIEEEVELINIEETINGLNDSSNYAIYIDKYGDLYISYIVKTSQVDYNETMKLN